MYINIYIYSNQYITNVKFSISSSNDKLSLVRFCESTTVIYINYLIILHI